MNSIRSRIDHVKEWLITNKIDILCLQETKTEDKFFPIEIFSNLGYEVSISGQKSYNGVAIISKIQIENIQKGFGDNVEDQNVFKKFIDQKRLISADINGIKIINVYVPNGSSLNSEKFEYKINWLNYLALLLDQQEKKGNLVCLLGDFNIAPSNKDIYDPLKFEGGIMASEIERNALNNVLKGRFIDAFRIFEKNTGHWSWWDYRNNAYELNKGWRIDHIYLSKTLAPRLKSCVIDSHPRGNLQPSDHAPVMINIDLNNLNEYYIDEEEDFFEI